MVTPGVLEVRPGAAPACGVGAATEAGEARREFLLPPRRKQARSDHAFRAGFQAFLQSQGVREAVIGHQSGTRRKASAGSTTRRRTASRLRLEVQRPRSFLGSVDIGSAPEHAYQLSRETLGHPTARGELAGPSGRERSDATVAAHRSAGPSPR